MYSKLKYKNLSATVIPPLHALQQCTDVTMVETARAAKININHFRYNVRLLLFELGPELLQIMDEIIQKHPEWNDENLAVK